MTVERYTKVFSPMPTSNLAARLKEEIAYVTGELARGPAFYLRNAFLPDNAKDLLPLRLIRRFADAISSFSAHPLSFISVVFSSGPEGAMKRRGLFPMMAASAAIHAVLIGYIIYAAVLSPYKGFTLVDKPYRAYKPMVAIAPPSTRRLAGPAPGEVETLEEIRKRDREKAEREKAEREKVERERAEREKAEKEAAEKKAKEEAAENKPDPSKYGEINSAPIRDLIAKLYSLYQEGGLDMPDMRFSVMAGFKIEPDGSLSNIRILKSSGSRFIDAKAEEILWNIGESHALGPLSKLTSNSVRLDLTDKITRLTITGFAPTEEEANIKAKELNMLFFGLRFFQKNSVAAELLSMVKVRNDSKRIHAELTVSRSRATEMMRAEFGGAPNTPPR